MEYTVPCLKKKAMLIYIERSFDCLIITVSSQFIVVFIFPNADNSFGLLVLIITVRYTKNSLKM